MSNLGSGESAGGALGGVAPGDDARFVSEAGWLARRRRPVASAFTVDTHCSRCR